MKITDIRWAALAGNFDWLVVRVDTDEGLYGWGECFWGVGVNEMLRTMKPLLIGENPMDVGRLYEKLIRSMSGVGSLAGTSVTAITAVEFALWDITGKALGAPVYQLLGGRHRERVRLYADCHAGESLESDTEARRITVRDKTKACARATHTPEAYAARAKEVLAAGWTALKFDLDVPLAWQHDAFNRCLSNGQLAQMEAVVAAVREAVGPETDICFDCHWAFNVNDAIKLADRLTKYEIMWLEDPIPAENIDALVKVTQDTKTPICTGENYFRKFGFKELIEKQAVDIVSPDISRLGGLLEAFKIAALADMYYIPVAPHNITGPIGTFAAAHLSAAIPNFLVMEFHAMDVDWFEDLIAQDEPVIREGYFHFTGKPGLGIEIDDDVARAHLLPGEKWFDE
ncbi:MAG: mandelate racemase/muconate lactonizing enzyme family protein [Chloroflexi bacterium]|nr:mandelate racemase/muconate lactonizing enzyme family protein [Chloroflexota bacterium]